jgi:hypothetical protein
MATPVPKNVAAALGLVPTVVSGVRRLPAKAVQLPVIAVDTALSGLEAFRREYGELADRGEKLIARLRGSSLDALEGTVDSVLGTSTENAKQAVQVQSDRAKDRAEADAAVAVAEQQTLPVEEPTPPSTARVDSAATPEVVEQVEKIAHNIDAPLVTDAADLPLPDYDHMTLGALRGRLRSLDMEQLVQIRDYEKAKAHRLPVITMLDNRIAKLSNGEAAPTGATPAEPSDKASTVNKPPKTIAATAAAKTSPTPPHTKVRVT